MLNGLLPNADPLRAFDPERLLKAEERTAGLITCIQPNQSSEVRRNKVTDDMQQLIIKCFPCQVFTFGSLPLKTYLPDEEINLVVISSNQNLDDAWANEVLRDMLEKEKKNDENVEFHVKEVQYIQEVKIIRCLVENIVVDISFNQLDGLCSLCFLEEVDHMINQNHLFKRSIILIKAWCSYESRILGARYGLISTYALETLVVYIFHVYNNSFAGPLEVLYRFLELFSNFDWENFCVSLSGPVPISSLPTVTAEPPRKDGGELLLSEVFLKACTSRYSVFPTSPENQGQQFVSEHFNVIDPLRINNNLGRSVTKGNLLRIRSAFAFGAKKLARLLDCPKDNIPFEVNQFFSNRWDHHGPVAQRSELLHTILSTPDDAPSVTPVVIEYEYDYKYETENNYDPKQLVFGSMGREGPFNPGHEQAQTSGPNPMGPGTQQRMIDNSSGGDLPFRFYPTSPPVPSLMMFPLPPGTGTYDATTSHYSGEEGLDNTDPRQKFDSSKVPDQSEDLANINTASDEQMSDILNSDFSSHWANLQYRQFSRNPQPQVSIAYMVPPTYLHVLFRWDIPGIPVGSNRPPNLYQHNVDELPRYDGGTTIYVPNPRLLAGILQATAGETTTTIETTAEHGEREGNNWNRNTVNTI